MKYCTSCRRSWEDDFRICPIDGSPLGEMPAGTDPYIGRSIGRCRVIEKVADGELGPIYKAEEPVRAVVALQILSPERLGSPVLLEAFGDAVKQSARLNHPNVVRTYGLETAPDGTTAVLMEFVQGASLDRYRKQHPGISPQESAGIIRQAAEGVLAGHRMSMLHGALHPSRILVASDGTVKVAGFHRSGVRSGVDVFSVTPQTLPYLAPEQVGIVRDLPAPDYRADVYSLGVILYELLAGRLPYDAKNPQDLATIMEGAPPLPPSFTNPQVSPLLARVVLRAFAKHPTERHASLDDFVRELDAAGRQVPEPQRPAYSAPPPHYAPPPPSDSGLFPPPPPMPPSDLFAPAPPAGKESVEKMWPEVAQDKSNSGEGSVFSWFKTRVGGRPKGAETDFGARAPAREDSSSGTDVFGGRGESGERTVVVSGSSRGRKRGSSDTFNDFGTRDQDMTGTGTLPRRRLSSKVYLGLGIGAIVLLSAIFFWLYYSSSKPAGKLMVDSTPPEAQVFLNDEYRGQTPLPYTELTPGSYRVRIQLDGYETKVDLVDVIENADIQRAYVLTAQAQLTPPPPPPPELTPARNEPPPPPKVAGSSSRFEGLFTASLRARNFFAPSPDSAWDALTRWQQAEGGEPSRALLQARQSFCTELSAVGREKLELRDFPAVKDLIGQARTRNVDEACYSSLQTAYDQVISASMNDLRMKARAAMERQNYVTPEAEDNALRNVRLMLAINPQESEALVLEKDIFTRAWDQALAKSGARQHQEALEILNQLRRHYPSPPVAPSEIDKRIETEQRRLKLLASMKVPFSVRVKHNHGRKYVLFGASECTGILRVDGFAIEYQSASEHAFKVAYTGLKSAPAQKNKITIQGVGVPEGKIELEPGDETQGQAFNQLPAKIQEYQRLYVEYMK